ncbi:TRAM domain-containing protein [Candidatus Woesearchaeota archaeon]|nr:TRAM domain-containing protein [Candidatus Woesearchaeota archaeon]
MQRHGGGPMRPPVKVGDEVDVTIDAVGEKGDGIAKVQGFVLFVPGVKQGQTVKVKVTKVLRRVGFAEVVGEASEPSEAPEDEAEEAPEEEAEQESDEESEEFGEEEPAEEADEDLEGLKAPKSDEDSEEEPEEEPEDEPSDDQDIVEPEEEE